MLRAGMIECCYPPPGSKWFRMSWLMDIYRRRRLAVRYFCRGFLACLALVMVLAAFIILWWL